MAKREIVTGFEIEDGKIVRGEVKVLVTVSEGRGADKVEHVKDMVHYLDYTGCELADLVDSAASADVVSLQNGVWRGMGAGVGSEAGKTTKMAEWYKRERAARGPVDPTKAALKLEGEALDNLIAALIAKKGGMSS